jgi:uncharacterized damage-inducible protein DinB
MSESLLYAFRHNTWATLRLIEVLRTLSREQLRATLSGVYGDPLSTLDHILSNEAAHGHLVEHGTLAFERHKAESPSLDELELQAHEIAGFWERLLAQPLDPARIVVRSWPDGARDEAPAGVVLAQILHHGNVHREQISAVLTSLGLTVPEIDVWAYGDAAGLSRMYVRD